RAVAGAVALDTVGRRDPGRRAGHPVPDDDVGLTVGVAGDQRRGVRPEGHEPAVPADGGVAADDAAAVGPGGLAAAGLDAGLLDRPVAEVLHVDVGVAA